MKGILKFPFVNNKPVISAVPPGSSIDQEQKQHVEGDTEYSAGTKMIHAFKYERLLENPRGQFTIGVFDSQMPAGYIWFLDMS